eukprot:TRINITY_DN18465_c0_g1_i1.p1 TRINITY_DN18465_c0_g1~~TRINITY_DN18465_c0_g1_i1.p1  ORF type:complete len:322 (-),score=95.06 TRINITY_DN18465_c0_g1_i1:51-923(-)
MAKNVCSVGSYEANIQKAAAFIKSKAPSFFPAQVAMILGSGLGGLADNIENRPIKPLPFGSIPGFPVSTAPGHKGMLHFGTINGVKVVVMQGRFHLYEGYDPRLITFPIRVFHQLGITKLVVTNAAGAVNDKFHEGEIMMITDHINYTGQNPLVGPNLNKYGVRFPDMGDAYTPRLQKVLEEEAGKLSVILRKGVYMCFKGPTYETPAEVRMARTVGADAVGMSTVMETIVAHHQGMEVLGISSICNMGAGILPVKLTEHDVIDAANKVGPVLAKLLYAVLPRVALQARL